MATTAVRAPSSGAELAAALAEANTTVRVRGAATKLGWAAATEPGLELSTAGLDRVVEHNAGDLTAVLEAGVPLERAQAKFAEAGQMLALDPPGAGATIGGIIAAGDSGPLRTRYGSPRDLVLGMRVALADGTVARSGAKVIKNVAGYDLAKLFTGSFGTLGAILEVSVRLHPLPPATATAVGRSADPGAIARGASALSHARLEQLGLDVRWAGGAGLVLSRYGGVAARPQADAAERLLRETGLRTEVREEDELLWSEQRDGQRSPGGLAVRVSGVQTDMPRLLGVAERHGATLVGRAGLGLSWLRLDDGDADALVADLRGFCLATVLDRPAGLEAEPWPAPDPGAAELMRRLKERFDPEGKLV
ncbi:MAG: glycolate oxidase binding subunit [Thermoleophilaceae bacterium]|jgi:glycolate oxidase FAD binding subunit|nr:glycolate oxidase binding subunit [Thermoleophilaceae bacterium]